MSNESPKGPMQEPFVYVQGMSSAMPASEAAKYAELEPFQESPTRKAKWLRWIRRREAPPTWDSRSSAVLQSTGSTRSSRVVVEHSQRDCVTGDRSSYEAGLC